MNSVDNTFARLPKDLAAKIEAKCKLFGDLMANESDRGCVIIGAENLSNDLENLLKASFRNDANIVKNTIDPLFKGYSPLSTFSARIQIAYASYLIPKIIYSRLNIIRKIRNHFAHSLLRVSLKDPACRDNLYNLAFKRGPKEVLDEKLKKLPLKFWFVTPVIVVDTALHILIHLAGSGANLKRVIADFEKHGVFEYA